MIDLRSDTVTRPTPEMREAMLRAEVGDDVFGEDPTVRELEATVAGLLGKAHGLFVPTGVMGNQLAVKVHTQPGEEVILDRKAHIFNYESGAAGLLSGVTLHVIDGERGCFTAEQAEAAIRPPAYYNPRTRLIACENTVNSGGGSIYPLTELQRIGELARRRGLKAHLDGARLWNANVATGVSLSDYAAPFDTISICLSKGLGAPVGSVLVSTDQATHDEARRFRKLFGGGMRQVGMLAAAGLFAIEHHWSALADDHRKARELAAGLAAVPGITVTPPETNILLFDVSGLGLTATAALDQLSAVGIGLVPFGPTVLRAVTHRDVSLDDCRRAVDLIAQTLTAPTA